MENALQEEKKRRGRKPAEKVATPEDDIGNDGLTSSVREESEDTVTLSRAELDALLNRISRLENPGAPQRARRVKEHFAILREWEDSLVVGVKSVKENVRVPIDDPDRMQLAISLREKDGKLKDLIVPYLIFLNEAPKVRVKFEKVRHEPRVATELREGGGGWHDKEAVDKEGRFTDAKTGQLIPLDVEFIDTFIDLEVLEGIFEGEKISFGPKDLQAINL